MENRYSLRFETGERQGETIPIPASGMTLGRKPGNTLQVTDTSISGQHAELRLEGGSVLLRDLGSTNGTRVGSDRLLQRTDRRLAPGDVIHFGSVRATFLDAAGAGSAHGSAGRAPESSKTHSVDSDGDGIEIEGLDEPVSAAPGGVDTGLERVSADVLARSKKRSFAGIAVVLALAAGGAGLWYWLDRSGGGGANPAAVVDVPGNLLGAGYSFESDDDGFTAAEGPAAFVKSGTARHSGAFGLEAELAPGEWALHGSRTVRVDGGREFVARAVLAQDGGAVAALGVELSAPPSSEAATDAPPTVVAWSAPIADAGSFEPVEVAVVVPPPWTRARVVVLGRVDANATAGSVRVDDVSLVAGANGAKAAASVAGAALYELGAPPTSIQLVALERALVSSIEFLPNADAPAWSAKPVAVRADGTRLIVEPRGEAGGVLSLRVDGALARSRLATIGADGYRTHGLEFERAGVETLLFGGGVDMVRLQLKSPATVTATSDGSSARLRLAPAAGAELQVDFAAERKEAGNLAYAARAAEQKGELGAAIVQWKRLLDGLPYEEALVIEAEAARTRLVQKGLADLRVVTAEAERAQFFRLPDLYRRSRDSASAIAVKYATSEVEVEARKVIASLDAQIAELESDLHATERERMKSILAALEAQGATKLAAEVRDYLANELGEKP